MRRRIPAPGILLAATATLLLGTSSVVGQELPSPESHFGYEPGTDRRLADWTELTAYYERLAEASPRVVLDTLGTTTRGRPLVMLTLTSEANHARLEELRQTQQLLADPRRIGDDAELEGLLEGGRAVVLITHGIHSTEVGSVMVAPRLVYRLAASREAEIAEILDNVVVLDIPSLNPDGTDWIADWYQRWVGTEHEAAPLPWLYHFYTGHDNNRDWYAFTQAETEHVVRGAHNAWHPHIVHDIHQMGRDGPRIFLPPYAEPWEPNVDPALTAAVNDLGTWAATSLLTEGKQGVVVNAIYDAFTPARAYQHYHAGARILSETASANAASPDSVFPWELRSGRGYDPGIRSWNHPEPWEGGRWGLPEITDYMESAAMAVLRHAARNRRHWLETAHGINRRAVEGWPEWPEAWVIPVEESEKVGLSHMLQILRLAEVEVHRTRDALDLGGRALEAGSWVIPMSQPYAGFAQTLLEVQDYPDLRRYPDGPPIRPYDATAHTLPLLMGVEAIPVDSLPPLELGPIIPEPAREFRLPTELTGSSPPRIALYKSDQEPMEAGWTRWLFDRHGLVYDTLGTTEIREGDLREAYDVVVLQSQSYGSIVNGWSVGEVPSEWAGGVGVDGSRALRDFVRNGGRLVAMEQATDFVVRILGLDVANAVERLPPEEFFVPGSIVRLVLESDSLAAAWTAGRAGPADSTAAGAGADPAEEDSGASGTGTGETAESTQTAGPTQAAGSTEVVGVTESSESSDDSENAETVGILENLENPGTDEGPAAVEATESSTVREVVVGPLERELGVWYGEDSRAFTVTDPAVRVLARYAEVAPLLSGWMLGGDHLAGRPALVEADVGRGSVVLFGFQPNYRGQSVSAWPLLFEALIPEATGPTAGGDP